MLAATAVSAAGTSRERKVNILCHLRTRRLKISLKSIYSPPDQPLALEDTQPSALEYNIALARTYTENYYSQSHGWVKNRVESWISLEEKVEREFTIDAFEISK